MGLPFRRLLRLLLVSATSNALLLIAAAAVLRQPSVGSLPSVLPQRADRSALERHVLALSVDFNPRDVDHPGNLAKAADYIATRLRRTTPFFERQRYSIRGSTFENEVARFGPAAGRPLVVGAHYDSFGDFGPNPGADDNASGVAGLLELARLLAGAPLPVPVEIVAFSTEEPPFFGSSQMGSAVHARRLAEAGRSPIAMICLEMIGYFSPRQPWPNWLWSLAYTDRGDFVAVAGRWRDRAILRYFKRAVRGSSRLPVYSFLGTADMLDASDQRSYWAHGWPAVLVTDTAFLRNPNYHAATDSAATLDYRRMAAVVDGVANAVLHADTLAP